MKPLAILAALLLVGSATPRPAAHPRTYAGSTAPVETAEQRTGAPQTVLGRVDRPSALDALPPLAGLLDASQPGVARAAIPSPAPTASIGTALYSGLATWFPASGYQGAVPWWKPGQDPLVVAVSAFRDGRTYSTSVLVTGWCACGDRDGLPTVIDLSPRAFAELAPLSVGVVSVQVELPTQGPVLPATDQ